MTCVNQRKRSRSLDDGRTEQIPTSFSEEFSFGNSLLILENELEISGILNHHPGWKTGDRDLVCLESERFLALHEPVE
jgi:hypothetical protein